MRRRRKCGVKGLEMDVRVLEHFQLGGPAPRGHWAMSWHIYGCQTRAGGSWHLGGGARDAAPHPTEPRTAPQR